MHDQSLIQVSQWNKIRFMVPNFQEKEFGRVIPIGTN